MESEYSDTSESEPTWRICYSGNRNEDDIEGKLICPWAWKGSIRFVHSNWIEQWAQISRNSYDSMETLKWELCHAIYEKRRQLLSLKKILKNLIKNFFNHISIHFESIVILAYMGFLAYRGINDAKLIYLPYKKRFGKPLATAWVIMYTTIVLVQIACLLKNEIKRLVKFFYIFKDSLFSYKYCDR